MRLIKHNPTTLKLQSDSPFPAQSRVHPESATVPHQTRDGQPIGNHQIGLINALSIIADGTYTPMGRTRIGHTLHIATHVIKYQIRYIHVKSRQIKGQSTRRRAKNKNKEINSKREHISPTTRGFHGCCHRRNRFLKISKQKINAKQK